MENIKTCELCLEQIIKTEDFVNLNCDEKQNLKILKNLEISVSRDAKICFNCVNISHLTYNFKMSCLTNNDHLKTLIHPGINDKLILEEVVVKKANSELKNVEKVCRFCLNFFERNSLVKVNLEQDVILKDMLERCLPEIGMNIVQYPLICYICSELLEKLFNFISQCKVTEVFRNLDTKPDILGNENMSTVTVENNDNNIDNSSVKKENCRGVEYPEFQIKSEDFDIDDDIKDSINESNCVEEKEVKSKPCDMINEKKFVCDICSYQTTTNSMLKQHHLIHKQPLKVNDFKCDYCSFATKWKMNLTLHSIRHKNPSELPKFKCNNCLYETNNRRYLVRHVLVHKDPSNVNTYKCKVWPYQMKYRCSIQVHERKHQVEIMGHLRCHKERKQPTKSNQNQKGSHYKCNKCSYVGTRKSNLIQHQRTHKDPSEREMYNCTECPFQALYKITLKRHYKKDHSDLEVPFGKLMTFRCNECDYETMHRTGILKHLQAHEQKKMTTSVKKNCKIRRVHNQLGFSKFMRNGLF